MSFKQVLVAAALVLGSAASSQAAPMTWTDVINFSPAHYFAPQSSLDYTHSILDNGFTPGEDTVSGYQLSVNLFDDHDRDLDVALVNVPGLIGDTLFFALSGVEYGGWSLQGYASLMNFGTYAVTISSLVGDFYLGSSTLTVQGQDNSVKTPEPGTLALLGAGLLGLGLVRGRTRGLARQTA